VDDAAAAADVPGAKRKRPAARTRAVCLSPTGRCWAAATTEGLLLYELDSGAAFDPTDLTEDLTPAAAHAALAARAYPRALLIAMRLGDGPLLRHALLSTPAASVAAVAAALPPAHVPALLAAVAQLLSESPHTQFLLQWVRAACVRHGPQLAAGGAGQLPVLRALHKSLSKLGADVGAATASNIYTLEWLVGGGDGGGGGGGAE